MNAISLGVPSVAVEQVASLPMYDLPELQAANDELWRAVAERLRDAGLSRVPSSLTRSRSPEAVCGDPDLLLTQTCGYPCALGRRGQVRVVVTPGYAARGCQGPYHRSVILVRASDRAQTLAQMRGTRLAMNAPDSNTGMNLMRAELAPLADAGQFFRNVVETGAHAASAAAVAEDQADLAAVDCVTWAHLQRFAPELTDSLRVLAWSGRSLGLPLVTGRLTSAKAFGLLVRVLDDVALDPKLERVRRTLLLDRFYRLLDSEYQSLLRLDQASRTRRDED